MQMPCAMQSGGARDRRRCAGRLLGIFALLALVGCSATHRISLDTLSSDGVGQARVITRDGYSYDFERVAVRGDSLIGTYVVVEERIYGRDEIAYVDVERQTVLPLSVVEQVETRRIDIGNTLMLGAGATLFAIWAHSVVEPDEPEIDEIGGGGKPPQGGP
ncbi:MAG: hypothetical protein GF330_02895 [Candidatus Eisenbacteria bacterium]|nr:hypothetical protein [Candidatus Eisenbacteria bacterium]